MEPNQKRTNVYDPRVEHDACGIGAVVSLKGTQARMSAVSPVFLLNPKSARLT